MSYKLHPITPQDIPTLYPIYNLAFSSTPFQLATFPPSAISPSAMENWFQTRFQKMLSKPEVHAFKIIYTPSTSTTSPDSSGPTNPKEEIVAFGRYSFPYTPTPPEKVLREVEKEKKRQEKEAGIPDPSWPNGVNLELVEAKFGGLDGMREKYVDSEKDYVCSLLAVHPDHQRKGLGKMLLKHVLDMADAEGQRVYIEATDAGFPVYKKLGFEQVDILSVDMSKWGLDEPGQNRIMIREPLSKS